MKSSATSSAPTGSRSRWLPPGVRARAAGIYEGEGWLSLARRRRANGSCAYSLIAGVNNTSVEVLDFLAEHWGGSRGCYERQGYRPLHTWRLSGRSAVEFLRDVEPFILSARLRAKVDIGIRFHLLHESSNVSGPHRQRDEDALALAMQALNRRGAASLRNEDCYDLVADLNRRLGTHVKVFRHERTKPKSERSP